MRAVAAVRAGRVLLSFTGSHRSTRVMLAHSDPRQLLVWQICRTSKTSVTAPAGSPALISPIWWCGRANEFSPR
jgi:hypothetical protein